MIYQLKFESKAAWESFKPSLYQGGIPKFDIDSIIALGILWEQPSWDPTEDEKPEPIPLPGYHVDISTREVIPIVELYRVFPTNPQHHFSGGRSIAPILPTISMLKDDIRQWLTNNGYAWSEEMTKQELIDLLYVD